MDLFYWYSTMYLQIWWLSPMPRSMIIYCVSLILHWLPPLSYTWLQFLRPSLMKSWFLTSLICPHGVFFFLIYSTKHNVKKIRSYCYGKEFLFLFSNPAMTVSKKLFLTALVICKEKQRNKFQHTIAEVKFR